MERLVLLSLLVWTCYGTVYRDFYFNGTLSEVTGCTTLQPLGLKLNGLNTANANYHFTSANINGVNATVLYFNNTGLLFNTAPPNGGSPYVYEYTLVMDVLFDLNNRNNVIPIYNTVTNNRQISQASLRSGQGLSIDEVTFMRNFTLNMWYRIIIVADLMNCNLNFTIFNGTNGAVLVSKDADIAWSLFSYPDGTAPDNGGVLFSSSDVVGPSGYIRFFRFYDYAISPLDVTNLGGPSATPPAFIASSCAAPPYTDPLPPPNQQPGNSGSNGVINPGNSLPNNLVQNQNSNPFSGPTFNIVVGVSVGATVFVLVAIAVWATLLFVWKRNQRKEQADRAVVVLTNPTGIETPMPKSGYEVLTSVNSSQSSQPYANIKPTTYGVAIDANT